MKNHIGLFKNSDKKHGPLRIYTYFIKMINIHFNRLLFT